MLQVQDPLRQDPQHHQLHREEEWPQVCPTGREGLGRVSGLDLGLEGQRVGRDGPGEGVGGVLVAQTSHYRYLLPVYQGGQAGVV